MNQQLPVLYHGTTKSLARAILNSGFKFADIPSYTGTSVNFSECISVAYEYGEYEYQGVVLEVTLKSNTIFDNFGLKAPEGGYDEWFERTNSDAAKIYGGNVWLVRNLRCIDSVRILEHKEALQLLLAEFDEDGPQCGYNGIAGEYADIWHGNSNADWMRRFPDTKTERVNRLTEFFGRCRSNPETLELQKESQGDWFAASDSSCEGPCLKEQVFKQFDFTALWTLAIEQAYKEEDASTVTRQAFNAVFYQGGAVVVDAPMPRSSNFPNAVESKLQTVAQEILSKMYQFACTYFSNGIASLDIRRDDLESAAKYGRAYKLDKFDPQAGWGWLEKTYGGNAGVDHAYGQLAATLVSELGLTRNPPFFRGGNLIVKTSMYGSHTYDSSFSWGYSSINSLKSVCKALAGVLSWMGETTKAEEMLNVFFHSKMNNTSWCVKSRERFVLCNEITFVAFQNKVEIHLAPGIAEQFQLFIATYGKPMNLGA